ncbi:hypothetical protein MXB_4949, partial [Myxobolus squamalis]
PNSITGPIDFDKFLTRFIKEYYGGKTVYEFKKILLKIISCIRRTQACCLMKKAIQLKLITDGPQRNSYIFNKKDDLEKLKRICAYIESCASKTRKSISKQDKLLFDKIRTLYSLDKDILEILT